MDPLAVPHAAKTPMPNVAMPNPAKATMHPICLATTKFHVESSSLAKSLLTTGLAAGRESGWRIKYERRTANC